MALPVPSKLAVAGIDLRSVADYKRGIDVVSTHRLLMHLDIRLAGQW